MGLPWHSSKNMFLNPFLTRTSEACPESPQPSNPKPYTLNRRTEQGGPGSRGRRLPPRKTEALRGWSPEHFGPTPSAGKTMAPKNTMTLSRTFKGLGFKTLFWEPPQNPRSKVAKNQPNFQGFGDSCRPTGFPHNYGLGFSRVFSSFQQFAFRA